MGNALIIKKFKELGLNVNEAKSYLSLLERETLSVTEVARLARIPRTNAYEALETLHAKGFCIERPGKVKQFSALDPVLFEERAIMALDEYYEEELKGLDKKRAKLMADKKAAKARVATLIKELVSIYHGGNDHNRPLDYIEIIKDSHLVHRKFLEFTDQAKSEILVFSKPPYSVSREGLEEQTQNQSGLLERGVKIRSIYEIPTDKDEWEWWYNDMDACARNGEESRIIERLPTKMAIFDERIVMQIFQDPVVGRTTFTAQIIDHPSYASGLKILFEAYWEKARDYREMEKAIKVGGTAS